MHKGDIWLINLDPSIGSEIRKTRPAVIVNDNAIGILPLRVIVPLMAWKDRYTVASWMVRIDPDIANDLSKPSTADAFQIRSVSCDRFVKKIGQVSEVLLEEILTAIRVVIGA
ncbi:MAG: type II toxin-antitoxin system PemK/MazF family toxin [Chloroflexota bacterium]